MPDCRQAGNNGILNRTLLLIKINILLSFSSYINSYVLFLS